MEKNIFKYLLLASVVFTVPGIVFGRCFYQPKQTFTMKVFNCSEITLDASISYKRLSYFNDKSGALVSGVLLSGNVIRNNFNWEGHPERNIGNNWKPNDYIQVFVQGDAKTYCDRAFPVTKDFELSRHCCDVLPQRGLCLVPSALPIAIEKDVSKDDD